MASPWMVDLLGADAELAVEVAWGADLAADPDTWSWTAITGDVRDDPGIASRKGRADEASSTQPAACTLTLDNRSGDYSMGPESANYPNVRRSTPLRVTVDPDGDGHATVFEGRVVTWQPEWPDRAAPVVHVEAAGTLRRLGQGDSPVQSTLRRSTPEDPDVLAYWPCEDGKDASSLAAVVGDSALIWMLDPPNLAANTSFLASDALPVLRGSWLVAPIPFHAATGELQVRFLCEFPADGDTNLGGVVSIHFADGTIGEIEVQYTSASDGQLNVKAYGPTGSLLDQTGAVAFNVNLEPHTRRWQLELSQDGADVDVALWTLGANQDTSGGGYSDTFTGQTLGRAYQIGFNDAPTALLQDVAIGHVAVSTAIDGVFSDFGAFTAWRGELADDRLIRLAEENNETVEIVGQSTVTLGPQTPDTVLGLLRDAELADGGTLIDGHGPGLTYITRTERENAVPVLEVDATSGAIKPPFDVIDDDQRTRNRAVVTRRQAGSFTVTDTDGPLGTDTIGVYDTSATVNLEQDPDTVGFASWLVHLGTFEGYRHPTVTFQLAANPELARDLLAVTVGSRIDLTNLNDALTAYPDPFGPTSLLVEGISHRLNARSWIVTLSCSPWDPWRVAQLTATSTAIHNLSAATASGSSASSGPSDAMVLGSLAGTDGQAAPGDVLFAWVTVRNSGTGTVDTPDGWTELLAFGNVALIARVYRQGDFGPDVTASNGAVNATMIGHMFIARNVSRDLANVVAASATQLNGSAQDIAYPGLTVPEDDCLILVLGWKQDDWTSVAAIGGMTELFDASSFLGDDAGIVADYVVQTTASNISSGTLTVTGGSSAISRAVVVALRPDPFEERLTRLDTPGSTLTSSIAAGATSMQVTTTDAGTISFVAAGTLATGNNASVSPGTPAGTAAGDLLLTIASIRNSGTGTVNTPAGWNALLTFGNVSVFGKYVDGAAAPTISFSGGAANATTMARTFAFRGAHPDIASVLLASATQLNGSAQDIAYPARTVTQDACALVAIGWKQDDWTSVAQLSGFTEIADDATTTGDDAGMVVDYQVQTTATNLSSGSFTVTGGASAISRAIVLVLRPAPGFPWTTSSSDYPIDLDVGGVKITATACSDSVSPQTMTIEAAPLAVDAGATVQLWRPPVLAR